MGRSHLAQHLAGASLAPQELVLGLRGLTHSASGSARAAACSDRAPRRARAAFRVLQSKGLAATRQLPQPTLDFQVTKEACVSQGN